MKSSNILIIGTADTKSDELLFIKQCIEQDGNQALIMDVGVLGDPPFEPAYSKHDVAAAANTTNQAIIDLGDENHAMTKTAEGAATLARQLYDDGVVDGMLAIGGSMATDLALDVANNLPLGMPKFIVSTVSFSPILPPSRIPADVMMILWAGGLYGLNSICQSILSQAAGAIAGACRVGMKPQNEKPVIGMTSLGSSSLKYMVHLKPELEKRGYEVAVFHTTGMGGRAFESLAAQKKFAAVMDFGLVEVSNHYHGSTLSAGEDRLENAGQAGVPQIVAAGGLTLVDMVTWAERPPKFKDRTVHVHNRLIACAEMNAEDRRQSGHYIAEKLNKANSPTTFIMTKGGIDEWDKEGGPFHNPEALTALNNEIRATLNEEVELIELEAHINDKAFADAALATLDRWVEQGIVPQGQI